MTQAWESLFDLTIHSYYKDEIEAGSAACETLLNLTDVPWSIREQVRRNQVFYARSLSELVPDAIFKSITFPTNNRTRFNPSIHASDDGYMVNVRSANYLVNGGRYDLLGGDTAIRTTNYLVELDTALKLRSVTHLDDQTDPARRVAFHILGFEDCRLFRYRDSWHVSATTREHSEAGLAQIALLDIEDGALRNLRLLEGPTPDRHEKNWMPLATPEGLFFLYSCQPTVVLALDETSGSLRTIVNKEGPLIADGFRGGSQVIALEDGFLFMVHEAVTFEDGNRVYLHRFVGMSQAFDITSVSLPFYFLDRGLEFCAGLALRDGKLTASFGLGDRQAFLAQMPLDQVRAALRQL